MEQSCLFLLKSLRDAIFNSFSKITQSDLELAQVRSELVEVLLYVFVHDLLRNVVSLLLICDLNDGNDLLFIVNIEYWVINNMFEQLVSYRFDLLF